MTGESTPSMRFTLFRLGFMSVDLRSRGFDDRRPARELGLQHAGHVLGRAGSDVVAEIGHALDELRCLRRLHHRGVQPADDLARRSRGNGEAEPDARLVSWYAR